MHREHKGGIGEATEAKSAQGRGHTGLLWTNYTPFLWAQPFCDRNLFRCATKVCTSENSKLLFSDSAKATLAESVSPNLRRRLSEDPTILGTQYCHPLLSHSEMNFILKGNGTWVMYFLISSR